MTVTSAPLEALLDGLGYGPELRRPEVRPPGAETVLDLVAFTRVAPQDIRTSAIAASYLGSASPTAALSAARRMATPFALLADTDTDTIVVYRIAASPSDDEIVHRFDSAGPDEWEVAKFRRALDPAALQTAKSGMRQLPLFPVDVRLLQVARDQSIGSLSARLRTAFAHAHDAGRYRSTELARMVVTALACVIVRDKYGRGARTATTMVESALQKHPSYFAQLAEWEANDAATVERVLTELSEGLDYASVDARSVNSVYEELFITPELRKDLGIFYTDPHFATRILDSLPIEEIDPERRCVVDPACGSGNLLLAAQERLETLAPGSWSATETHEWLKTHLVGADIDPFATEVAKLSLLVSALPLGNTWQIETRDFLKDPPVLSSPPTLLVSNPPWHNPKGKRAETASQFLKGALDLLAEGGFLACIMPVAWLSGRQHRTSRRELSQRCDVFEVWRLPRDMFAPEARMGCAVVFARKCRTPERRWLAFRWINAGAEHRAGFIEDGEPTFAAIVEATDDGRSFTWGPLDDLRQTTRLKDVAQLRSGVVQCGAPAFGPPGKKRIPMILRGARPTIYLPVAAEAITWVDSIENFVATQAQVDALRAAPKLLIQADRFPDNPWRVRPVLDLTGVAPVGGWHAVVPPNERTAYALLAILASSPVSNWVHAHATTKRITIELAGQVPLPADWASTVTPLSRLGRQLAGGGPTPDLLADIEEVVADAYQLRRRDRRAIERMMAGYRAPEGTVRVPSPALPRPATSVNEAMETQAGTVTNIVRGRALVWTIGDEGDGQLVDLPPHMPGWLCAPGSTFDLEGDPQFGRYTFQRAAFVSDEVLFGVERDGAPRR